MQHFFYIADNDGIKRSVTTFVADALREGPEPSWGCRQKSQIEDRLERVEKAIGAILESLAKISLKQANQALEKLLPGTVIQEADSDHNIYG